MLTHVMTHVADIPHHTYGGVALVFTLRAFTRATCSCLSWSAAAFASRMCCARLGDTVFELPLPAEGTRCAHTSI